MEWPVLSPEFFGGDRRIHDSSDVEFLHDGGCGITHIVTAVEVLAQSPGRVAVDRHRGIVGRTATNSGVAGHRALVVIGVN